MSVTSPRGVARKRLIAFRIVVGAVLLIGLVGFNGLLVLPLISWLPEATLVESLDFPAQDIHHLVHGVGIGLWYGALLLSLAVQLRRPLRWVAPFWLSVYILGAQIVYDAVRGTADDPIWIVLYALFAAVVALHPRRTAPITRVNRTAALLAAAAAVPGVVYSWRQLVLQFGPADPLGHAAHNHFFGMAALAGLVVVAALLGSTDLPGRRLTAWIAGAVALLFGIASISHPDRASAWATGWSFAAIAWACAYLLVAVGPRRERARDGQPLVPAGATVPDGSR